ncbi:hypothetical protein SELMODRAFT_448386 [Selaginella moellendorffii]|uniref:CAAX prenyl protease 2/Lysostaphin resistance protein A-like domain-containing protein n=1 Tax=Selaginella moellendorffii TaxID=88036 RepID=D8T6W8_SELML|nr:hypothetical protein SELMODRAFT_448386 [Selaginella moellendorffii]
MAAALLRCLPHALAMLASNFIHYRSLWAAQETAARRVHARKRLLVDAYKQEHVPLTFDLMGSPEMRRARYTIKLLRYLITLAHIIAFYPLIEELHLEQFTVAWAVLAQAVIAGLLAGLVTIYLDENRHQEMRTAWNPAQDFGSKKVGAAWDCLRVAGGCLAVPIEEELFYHSWLYRFMLAKLSRDRSRGFEAVGLRTWNWLLCVASNGFFAVHNGMEWRSCLLAGCLFQWIIAYRGQFLDGLIAHVVCNITISCWLIADFGTSALKDLESITERHYFIAPTGHTRPLDWSASHVRISTTSGW